MTAMYVGLGCLAAVGGMAVPAASSAQIAPPGHGLPVRWQASSPKPGTGPSTSTKIARYPQPYKGSQHSESSHRRDAKRRHKLGAQGGDWHPVLRPLQAYGYSPAPGFSDARQGIVASTRDLQDRPVTGYLITAHRRDATVELRTFRLSRIPWKASSLDARWWTPEVEKEPVWVLHEWHPRTGWGSEPIATFVTARERPHSRAHVGEFLRTLDSSTEGAAWGHQPIPGIEG